MVERRDVELLIRAKDLSSKPLRDVATAVDTLTDRLQEQVAGLRNGQTAFRELSGTAKQLEAAFSGVLANNASLERFKQLTAANAQLADRLRTTSVALRDFKSSLADGETLTRKQTAELKSLEQANQRARAAFEKSSASVAAIGAQLEAAGISTRNFTEADRQVVSVLNQTSTALNTVRTAMDGYSASTRQAAEAQRLLRFQQQGARAVESIASAQSVATTVAPVASTRAFAASLREIADPAGEARRTLRGLEEQAESLGAEVAKINGPVRNYSETLLQLSAVQRAAVGSGELIDRFRQQADVLRQTRTQFTTARDAVRSLAHQVAAATEPNEALTRQLDQAKNTLAATAREYSRLRDAARQTQSALVVAGVDTSRLDREQARLETTLRKTKVATDQLTGAFARFGSGGSGGAGIFGLSPYAVQNLGFQINDFFTQIASGTSVTQAFAQQGGQVLQVFGPGAFSAVARWIPMIGAFAAAFGVAAFSISRLVQTSASLRQFTNLINTTAAGGTTGATAQSLTAIAREAERLGFAFDDAQKVVTEFFREGLSEARIRALLPAVRGLALSFGEDGVKAAERFTSVINGSLDDIRRLDDQIQFLTVSQRQNIAELFRAGDAAAGQRIAVQALEERYRGAAAVLETDFTRALRDAGNQFRALADEIGSGALGRAAIATLQQLSGLAERLARGLRAARGEAEQVQVTPQQAAALRVQQAQERVSNAERVVAEGSSFFRAGSRDRVQQAETNLPRYRQELQEAQAAVESLGRAQQNQARVQSEANDERRLQRGREFISNLERETAAARARTDAERRRIEVTRAGEAAVARAQQEGINDPGQTQTIRELAEATERARQARETSGGAASSVRRDFQAIQQDLQNTIRVRDETIRAIQEDIASGALTPVEAIERIRAAATQARPELQRLAEEARRFRDQNRSGDSVRRAALDSLVAQAERQAGAGGDRQGVNAVLQTQQQEVQRLFQERQQFIQTQNALVQQGVITQGDAQQRIQGFFQDTNEVLRQTVQAYEAAAQAAGLQGAQASQAAAQVQLWRAQIEYVNPRVTQLRTSIEQGFVQSFSTAFNAIGESIGNLLAGVSDLSTVFDDVGRAALQFAADFLKAIAQAIVQTQALTIAQLILRAVSGAFGGGGASTTGAVSVGRSHSGSVVGRGFPAYQMASPGWFSNAPRYHSGGVVGLKPDEVPAILQKGEEVLSRNDPRNVMNGARGEAPAAQSIRAVFAVGESEIANAMATAPGERVILETLRRNAPTLKQMLR